MSAPFRHISKGLGASLQVLQKISLAVPSHVTRTFPKCTAQFPCRAFSGLSKVDIRSAMQSSHSPSSSTQYEQGITSLMQKLSLLAVSSTSVVPTRSKVRFSRKRGKPKCVKAVIGRFYRLDWGVWIRTKSGRQAHLWRKSKTRQYRLRQHVFCTKTQSKLLDKMVTDDWKRKRNYVDDPYESYHVRNNLDQWFPRRSKPFLP